MSHRNALALVTLLAATGLSVATSPPHHPVEPNELLVVAEQIEGDVVVGAEEHRAERSLIVNIPGDVSASSDWFEGELRITGTIERSGGHPLLTEGVVVSLLSRTPGQDDWVVDSATVYEDQQGFGVWAGLPCSTGVDCELEYVVEVLLLGAGEATVTWTADLAYGYEELLEGSVELYEPEELF